LIVKAAKGCCAYLALFVFTIVLCGICNALPTAESLLYRAVQARAPVDGATLLRLGADPADGQRAAVPLLGSLLRAEAPLSAAAITSSIAAVAALIEAGARPEVGFTVGPLGALASDTPLSTAARGGIPAAVAAMLEAGARPEAGASLIFGALLSGTPLAMAAANGQTAAVEALLKGGARPEAGFTFGPLGALASDTPLSTAARVGNTAAVAALLEAGARPEAGASLIFGLLPLETPLAQAEASETSNEATRAALRAAVTRAADNKKL
jgi:ankyrin repeat protein